MFSFYQVAMSEFITNNDDLGWDCFVVTDVDDLRHVVERDLAERGWRHHVDTEADDDGNRRSESCVVRVFMSGRLSTEIDLRPHITGLDPECAADRRRRSVDWGAAAIPLLAGELLPPGRPVRINGVIYRHGHTRYL